MRVLGVDPGLTRCGFAVVDGAPGRRLTAVTYGVITTPPDAEIGVRLAEVADRLEAAIATHRPAAVAVERVFSQHNVRTVMGTAQASAMAILAATRAGLPVALHTPSEAKAAVTGSGRADKAQVTAMVTRVLGLPSPPRPADAADALALAICHLWRGGTQQRLAAAAAAVRAGATNRTRAVGSTPGARAGVTSSRTAVSEVPDRSDIDDRTGASVDPTGSGR